MANSVSHPLNALEMNEFHN